MREKMMSFGRELWVHLGGTRGECDQNMFHEENVFSKELIKVILK